MDIKHCDCLSWFSRRGESHEQDGETLPSGSRTEAASGDPAMAFEPSFALTGNGSARLRIGSGLAAGRTADKSGIRSAAREQTPRAIPQRRIPSRSINYL
jgi:hypothetical protein